MPYCIYLRKSRADMEAEERGEGDTYARHEKILTNLADTLKLDVNKIYREKPISGETIAVRPEVQALLSDVSEGLWDGVLVVEVERLARGDTIDQGIVAQAFKYSNTKIITPVKTYDPNNEFDEEYFEFGLFMSRREYKTINRRLQQGRILSVQEGNFIGNKAPYGYKIIKNEFGDYTLEIIEEEAEIVRLIFQWYIGKGSDHLGTGGIVKKLNEMGVSTKMNGKWVVSTIQSILRNPVYAGYIRWNHRKTVKKSVNGVVVKSRPRDRNAPIYKGKHQPIISKKIWDKAQENMLNNRAVPNPSGVATKNPLAGLIVCGCCGKKMVRRPISSRQPYEMLICQYSDCDNVASRLSLIEERIVDTLKSWLKNYKVEWDLNDNQFVKDTSAQKKVLETEIIKAEKRIEKLQIQKNNLFDLLEQKVYSIDTFTERTKIVTESLEIENEKLNNIQEKLTELEKGEETIKNIIPSLENIINVYQATSEPMLKNSLLKTVIKEIVYTKSEGGRWHNSLNDFSLIVKPKIML